jgi:hypothetical protein
MEVVHGHGFKRILERGATSAAHTVRPAVDGKNPAQFAMMAAEHKVECSPHDSFFHRWLLLWKHFRTGCARPRFHGGTMRDCSGTHITTSEVFSLPLLGTSRDTTMRLVKCGKWDDTFEGNYAFGGCEGAEIGVREGDEMDEVEDDERGMIILRRPNKRASSENAPGPSKAETMAMMTTSRPNGLP